MFINLFPSCETKVINRATISNTNHKIILRRNKKPVKSPLGMLYNIQFHIAVYE